MTMPAFWHDVFYAPLLNFLFWLYSGAAGQNFGVAIIELTVLLRLFLLPFTILDERSRYRYEQLMVKIGELERDFKSDAVMRKEKIRQLLKTHQVSYWSKMVVLGIQAFVLVLIYQVFLGGLRFTAEESLYAWVSVPVSVNTAFLGYDLTLRSWHWALAAGVYLFAQLYFSMRKNKRVTRADIMYLIFFPIFTALILWLLPMVKAVFILTSMIFSTLVRLVRVSLLTAKPEEIAAQAAVKPKA
jgi:membrane protein insertase Oxa1/YidC/SpoIIIJ